MKLFTRMICAILALATILSGAPAFAADAGKTASIWNERITVEGNQAYCRNEAGKETFFLSYGGAVYVPLRTAAEWLGKDLTKSGNTFTLSGSKSPVYQEQLPSSETVFGSVSTEEYWTRIKAPVPITVLSDAKLTVDGTAAALTDSTGKPVSLIDWNGEAYLPARSAAQLLGMDIKYQQYFRTDENGKKSAERRGDLYANQAHRRADDRGPRIYYKNIRSSRGNPEHFFFRKYKKLRSRRCYRFAVPCLCARLEGYPKAGLPHI